eukprot:300104-Prymnesium_polylepis.1
MRASIWPSARPRRPALRGEGEGWFASGPPFSVVARSFRTTARTHRKFPFSLRHSRRGCVLVRMQCVCAVLGVIT